MNINTMAFAVLLLLTSCTGVKPLKGGRAVTSHAASGIEQSLVQGENPAQPTRQDQESIKVRTYTLPAGSRIDPSSFPDSSGFERSNTPGASVFLSSPMPVTEREETRAKSELGASQKDSAREFAAKLSSLKGIVWLGVALLLFGLASLVWPPLRAIIGSITTSAAITLGGLALIILPTLIVGNELLILGAVTLAVMAWFLAHRHGQLRGLLSAISFTPGLGPNPPASAPADASAKTKN